MGQAMFRKWVQVVLASVVVLSLGMVANGATLKQVVAPDGSSLMVTGIDRVQRGPMGNETGMELLVITPHFDQEVVLLGRTTTVVTVTNDQVESVATYVDSTLSYTPAVPDDGYLLVGSGIASRFLQFFSAGDKVHIVDLPEDTDLMQATVVKVKGESFSISRVNQPRLTNELILYTPEFGSFTFTNPYGVDVAVVDGHVVDIRSRGTDTLFIIPPGGYVLSGHGDAGTWLETVMRVGTQVVLE